MAPGTTISIDSIGLPDSIRLFTQVKLNWSGTDEDGYVKGFRISWSTDETKAKSGLVFSQLVSNTDSTFLFNFTGAANIADIYFYVQAIDNKNQPDPNPAFLKIPVKNSAPSINFQLDGLPTNDTLWSVFSFPYQFSDPDGENNIDSVFLRINDSEWVSIPKNLNFLSVVPEDPSSLGETRCLLYAGENLATSNKEPSPLPGIFLNGVKLNSRNQFFLKVKDFAGAFSIDTTPVNYYIKAKTADLLIIDANDNEGFIGDTIYTNIVGEISNYDRIDMVVKSGKNQPKFWNASFYLLCKQYKKLFWYSDVISEIAGQTSLMLTFASGSLIQYLRFNGKLLACSNFPKTNLSNDDPIFSLIPIAKIQRETGEIRLRRNFPVVSLDPSFPNLRSIINNVPGAITDVNLFELKPGVDSLYKIRRTSLTSTYTGPELPLALRTKNSFNGKTNLIFFGMRLSYLSGDRQALKNTLNRILNEEFNW